MRTTDTHVCHRRRFGAARLWAVAGAGTVGILLTAGGVYAALDASASNTTAEQVSSGTLKLTLTDHGAGFGQQIANIAPSDVVYRYVDVTNAGTLAGRNLTLGVTDATPTALTTDPTRGLRVTVSQCSGADWNPATGACGSGGAVNQLINNATLAAVAGAPAVVVAGSVPAATGLHLQVAVALPDQTETTVNGVLPANSIQGLAANLTWTFDLAQRAGTTSTS